MEKQRCNFDSTDPSTISSFGDDLLTEILSRLPLKSIFIFKCVSKAWRNLICDDSFQRRLQLVMPGLFCRIHFSKPDGYYEVKEHKYNISGGNGRNSSVLDMSLSFLPCQSNFHIIDSCNGLLLCLHEESRQVTYYVCNPITKDWVALPNPQKIATLDNARLAFDPHVSPHYKVIRLSGCSKSSYIALEIFSSDIGKWAEHMVLHDPVTKALYPQNVVYINGIVHLLAYPHHIMVINLNEMTSRTINLPGNKKYDGFLGECKGYLHFATRNNSDLEVWMLKDYYSIEWMLNYSTNIGALLEKLPESSSSLSMCRCPSEFSIVGFHSYFEIIFLKTHRKLYSYHLATTRLEEICSPVICEKEHAYRLDDHQCFCAFPFNPCLNSLVTGDPMLIDNIMAVR